uniref:Anaphylatoxin-like domain-containing protein n=1 Tax=Terrapene triunguis TaxID=2587831 RepID=A0A674K1G2_9SAUR
RIQKRMMADYQDRKLKKCCEDGMHENPMGHSCEKRVGYILDMDECKKTFLDCCNYIKTIRDKLQRELPLQLARSKYRGFNILRGARLGGLLEN